jgi:histone acetyltransferase (RNA polymerase elongator complex component)
MNPQGTSAAGGANSTTGTTQANLSELQNLFDQFTQTLTQLRAITTEGQQKIETARARPQ